MGLRSVGGEVLGDRGAECRGRGALPNRGMDRRLAQGGREGGQALLPSRPWALPVPEGPHREAGAQGMQAGASARGRSAQAAWA